LVDLKDGQEDLSDKELESEYGRFLPLAHKMCACLKDQLIDLFNERALKGVYYTHTGPVRVCIGRHAAINENSKSTQ